MTWKRPFEPETPGGGGGGGTMSDAEVLAAVQRTDGAGSGYDADLVDGKHASEFLPAAGPVPDTALGNRTADQTLVNPANTGPLSSVLSWLAGAIKGITGETDWKNVPATTLKTLKTRADTHEGSRNGHPAATTTLDGLMVGADKARLDTMLAVAGTEVALSAATTLTTTAFGKMHALSGSTNYAVTLPAATGNAGKVIGFRVSGAATALVTLDGDASEAIDGSLTRTMWAQESAILLCDGAGWTKISGKTIPMMCRMRIQKAADPATAQLIAHNTGTKVLVNGIDFDSAGMANTTDSVMTVRRTGMYQAGILIYYFNGTGEAAARVLGSMIIETSPDTARVRVAAVQFESSGTAGSFLSAATTLPTNLIAAETVALNTFQNSGVGRYLFGHPTNAAALFHMTEIPKW